jgi:hypothetical protein
VQPPNYILHDVDERRGGRTTTISTRSLTTTDNATLTRAGCRGFCAAFGFNLIIAHNGGAKKRGVPLLNYW